MSQTKFVKSSYSGDDCVAVARGPEKVAVADTKQYGNHGVGPVVLASREAWSAALGMIR